MPNKVTIYHWSGPADLYTIDARDALQRHPGEWRTKEWPADEALKAAQAEARRQNVEYDKNWALSEVPAKIAEAKAKAKESKADDGKKS